MADGYPSSQWLRIEKLDCTYDTQTGEHHVQGWRATHDGPHRFENGECPCGVLDLGVVPVPVEPRQGMRW